MRKRLTRLAAMLGTPFVLALTGALLLAGANPARAAIEAYVLSGAAAPDGNGQFSTVRGPILNDAGQLAFYATMTGTTGGSSSNDRNGVFRREIDGTITQVARGLQAAPGVGGGVFSSFGGETPYLNDEGDVAFMAGGNAPGIYLGTPLVKIVRPNDVPPEGNGQFSLSSLGGLNDAGQVSYIASIGNATPSTSNQGVYRSDGTTTVKIARRGDVAPDGTSIFTSFGGTKINEAGQVVFLGSINSPGTSGAYRGDGMTTTLLAAIGQPAPGVGGGTAGTYGTISAPTSINDSGAAAFTAKITAASHGGVTGLFRSDGVTSALIFYQGQPAPDAFGGTTGAFSSLSSERAVVSNRGEVIVWAALTGTPGGSTDNRGLFIGDGTTNRQVVRNGDLAPDGNGRFAGFGRNTIINEAGQTAFYATHTGGSPLASGGIYFFDPSGGLTTVARNGQPLLGSTIASLSLAGHNLDTPINSMETSGLNERGQVAFQFRLATGTEGVAIWSPPDADFNDDGDVDGDDLAIWSTNYGDATATQPIGDASGDGTIDGTDFLIWQREVTSTPPVAVAVPEPLGLAAIMMAIATLAPAVAGRFRRLHEVNQYSIAF